MSKRRGAGPGRGGALQPRPTDASSRPGAPGEWSAAQDRLAARAVRLGWDRSREIRGRLEAAGVSPGDVGAVADLAPIPILDKDALPALQAADPPFGGMLAVPTSSLRRVYRSPGPIMDPQGDGDDFWRLAPAVRAAGMRPGDVVLNTFSYHLTPGGMMVDGALRAAGCAVIPGGVGNTAAQIELAVAAGATGYAGTPQFLLTLLERAHDAGRKLRFERALVTGAPLPPPLRARLQDEFGVDVYQSYGTADAGTLGYECGEKDGWHVAAEVVIELLVPGGGPSADGGPAADGRPVADGRPAAGDRPSAAARPAADGRPVAHGRFAADGEPGQVVVTSPNEAYPLVRFGTGDLSAWNREPCRCGRAGPRLTGFLGRVGEGVKVRGMFVHPRELGAAVAGFGAAGRWEAVVTEDPGGRDRLVLRVEAAPGRPFGEGDAAALAARISEAVKVRAEVEAARAGTVAEEAAGTLADRRGDGGR